MWGSACRTVARGIQSGPLRIENAGGAWVGTGSGIYSSDRGDIVASWFTGTGGYEGLAYFELRTGTGPGSTAGSIQGLVFPGDPPDLAALPAHVVATPAPASPSPAPAVAPTPPAIRYGPRADDVGHRGDDHLYRRGHRRPDRPSGRPHVLRERHPRRCRDTERCPRRRHVRRHRPWKIDVWGHTDDQFGSGIQWGLVRIVNAGGTWDCRVSGIVRQSGQHPRVLVHGNRRVRRARVLRGSSGRAVDELSIQGRQPVTPRRRDASRRGEIAPSGLHWRAARGKLHRGDTDSERAPRRSPSTPCSRWLTGLSRPRRRPRSTIQTCGAP